MLSVYFPLSVDKVAMPAASYRELECPLVRGGKTRRIFVKTGEQEAIIEKREKIYCTIMVHIRQQYARPFIKITVNELCIYRNILRPTPGVKRELTGEVNRQ